MSLEFTESSQWFRVSGLSMNWSSTGSLFFWIKLAAGGNNAAYACPVCLGTSTADRSVEWVENNNDNAWHLQLGGSSMSAGSVAHEDATWVAVGWAVGTNRKVYTGNASAMSEQSFSPGPGYYNNAVLALGQIVPGAAVTQYNGLIAHVRAFSGELSGADFLNEAQNSTPQTSGNVYNWPLDNSLIDTVAEATLVSQAGTTAYSTDTPYASGTSVAPLAMGAYSRMRNG